MQSKKWYKQNTFLYILAFNIIMTTFVVAYKPIIEIFFNIIANVDTEWLKHPFISKVGGKESYASVFTIINSLAILGAAIYAGRAYMIQAKALTDQVEMSRVKNLLQNTLRLESKFGQAVKMIDPNKIAGGWSSALRELVNMAEYNKAEFSSKAIFQILSSLKDFSDHIKHSDDDNSRQIEFMVELLAGLGRINIMLDEEGLPNNKYSIKNISIPIDITKRTTRKKDSSITINGEWLVTSQHFQGFNFINCDFNGVVFFECNFYEAHFSDCKNMKLLSCLISPSSIASSDDFSDQEIFITPIKFTDSKSNLFMWGTLDIFKQAKIESSLRAYEPITLKKNYDGWLKKPAPRTGFFFDYR